MKKMFTFHSTPLPRSTVLLLAPELLACHQRDQFILFFFIFHYEAEDAGTSNVSGTLWQY